jgi:hypothetical protein
METEYKKVSIFAENAAEQMLLHGKNGFRVTGIHDGIVTLVREVDSGDGWKRFVNIPDQPASSKESDNQIISFSLYRRNNTP